MSDGTVEAELYSGPVHYRDKAGKWLDIDTRVGAADKPGYAFGNTRNSFVSRFGQRSDELVEFEVDGRSISLGAVGAARTVAPRVSGSTVRFPQNRGGIDYKE